jgi:mercuric ion transport protein
MKTQCEPGCEPNDLAGHRIGWLIWGPSAVLFLAGIAWEAARPWLWVPALLVAGLACCANARRCRRLHCFLTGPVFLLAAVATVLDAANIVPVDWRWIVATVLGSTAIGYALEMMRGRYASRKTDDKREVELLYFAGCPNVPAAREQLRRAFRTIGVAPEWTEIDVADDAAPAHTRGYGSPSILVNGQDVTGAAPGDGSSCRVYVGSDVRGVPPVEAIVSALRVGLVGRRNQGIAANLAVLPGALLSVLPLVSCPSCWPAYAGVLGSLGLPFLMDAAWLLPITAAALLVALAGLAYRARQRRGIGPLIVGIAAATVVLLGKFVFRLDTAVYTGTMLLVSASVWNSWPKRIAPTCEPGRCAQTSA